MTATFSSRFVLVLLVMAGAWLAPQWATAQAQTPQEDKALGRPATASSVEGARQGGQCDERICAAGKANDGDPDTRWGSEYTDTESWQVDLGGPRAVDTVALVWHTARAQHYLISTSLDGKTFVDAADVRLDVSISELLVGLATKRFPRTTAFPARTARYVRVSSLERAPILRGKNVVFFGVSLWDVNVFGPVDAAATPPAQPQPGSPTPAPAPAPTGGSPVVSTPPTVQVTSSGAAAAANGPAARPGTSFDLPSTSPPPPSSSPKPTAPPSTPPSKPSTPPSKPAKVPSVARLRTLAPFPIVRIKGTVTASGAAIRLLSVRAPRGATVRVVCRGGGCPARVRLRKGGTSQFGELRRRLRAGAVIDVAVTQANRYGKHTRFVIRRSRAPRRTDRCTVGSAVRAVACPTT